MPYYTYILFSESRNRYYIGSCINKDTRLKQHNLGVTKSTKTGRPWEIVYYEIFSSRAEASKREYQIKRMKSRNYIESLIQDGMRGSSVV